MSTHMASPPGHRTAEQQGRITFLAMQTRNVTHCLPVRLRVLAWPNRLFCGDATWLRAGMGFLG
jgi:hypothetical protein